jgi:hypothetical protein
MRQEAKLMKQTFDEKSSWYKLLTNQTIKKLVVERSADGETASEQRKQFKKYLVNKICS